MPSKHNGGQSNRNLHLKPNYLYITFKTDILLLLYGSITQYDPINERISKHTLKYEKQFVEFFRISAFNFAKIFWLRWRHYFCPGCAHLCWDACLRCMCLGGGEWAIRQPHPLCYPACPCASTRQIFNTYSFPADAQLPTGNILCRRSGMGWGAAGGGDDEEDAAQVQPGHGYLHLMPSL